MSSLASGAVELATAMSTASESPTSNSATSNSATSNRTMNHRAAPSALAGGFPFDDASNER